MGCGAARDHRGGLSVNAAIGLRWLSWGGATGCVGWNEQIWDGDAMAKQLNCELLWARCLGLRGGTKADKIRYEEDNHDQSDGWIGWCWVAVRMR